MAIRHETIRTALKSKNDHVYKIAYLNCTLKLNSNSKNEVFSLKRRPKLVSKSAFVEIFIITGLKSDAILSVVDRNVAIFTTQHAITHYEF